MASTPHSSSALVRKGTDTDLMPPPPPAKRIKRPRQILEEDDYTAALSQIIARDFFPGLLETQIQQEYLDAIDSKDSAWISSAGRRLKQVMTPGHRRTPAFASNGGQTPSHYVGDTPASTTGSVAAPSEKPRLDINMSLSIFQATYTSEDNESFYQLIDKQNQKKAEKYGWLWRGNKLPSKQMMAQKKVIDELAKTRKSLVDDGFKRDRLAIKDADDRPARPETWSAAPKNGLMFLPDGLEDGVVTRAQDAEDASRMAPRAIVYENTRMPQPHLPQRPPSPGLSAVRDAIAGRPRRQDQDSSVAGGGETPRVNGYSFVDDEDDKPETSSGPGGSVPVIDLGPGIAHNPFKIQEQRKRESLHERMVDRIAKSKTESLRHGFTGKLAKGETPRFMSSSGISGSLTPAAQRLLNTMATPGRGKPGDSFGQGQPTPMRPRGSLLKSVTRKPNPK